MADVKQFIDVDQFHRDVMIEELNISESFVNQASLFAYYAALEFKAMRQASNFKIVRDALATKIDNELRNEAAKQAAVDLAADPKAKVVRLTEAQIETAIKGDKRYIEAVKAYNDADAILGFIKNALEAFKQRRDMLISLGANQREELKGELRMKASSQSSVLSRIQTELNAAA